VARFATGVTRQCRPTDAKTRHRAPPKFAGRGHERDRCDGKAARNGDHYTENRKKYNHRWTIEPCRHGISAQIALASARDSKNAAEVDGNERGKRNPREIDRISPAIPDPGEKMGAGMPEMAGMISAPGKSRRISKHQAKNPEMRSGTAEVPARFI
jgi:hypothetical protein